MKKFAVTTTVAAGLSAAVLGLAAPALAAPSGTDSAADTISRIEADGNRVIVNRQTSTPLSEAEVVAVRPGPAIREWVSVPGRQGDNRNKIDTVLQEVGTVFFVDVR
ncbi:Uncharacterised protein [Mycolicibacterium vanbaalenii]|uniref:Uncharacterized protein n=1 Tax=Mycolicibacterium vanbaalenii TaxID=110539 RepID=A0A5S9R715_MYCVN|nr:hypothetical protein [Mycolicibacterium vanbaalenii]CAA0130976.1 Uncharacterised protein [Mycolicibacterium vanbaalenii]